MAGTKKRIDEFVTNATAALSVFGGQAAILKALAAYVGIRKQ
jgi:hypothetical protein